MEEINWSEKCADANKVATRRSMHHTIESRKQVMRKRSTMGKKKYVSVSERTSSTSHNNGDDEKSSQEEETIKQSEVESDIEEDECIPNGCKLIECFVCGCRLSKIYNLRIHMASHMEESSYEIDVFEQSEIYDILNPHRRNIDWTIIRNFIIQEIKEKRYSQFYCILSEAGVELNISDSETDSDNAEELIPHNNYRCELCRKNYDRRYKALFHQKTAHTKEEFVAECDYCFKKYVSINLLIHHLKTQCENDEKPVPCTERFMKYLSKANLNYYAKLAQAREQKRIHKLSGAPKSYTCNICNKIFSRQEHLNRHNVVHLPDEMKFECTFCDRRFNRRDNMRAHMKVHSVDGTGDRESRIILCSYCGRSFSSKSNYVVHIRRHTGEKPYKCDVCGKGFPKSTDLNSHKITHTGEKNFICTICNKAFARSAVLSRHIRTHTGPFTCSFCSKLFTKPNALTNHLRTHIRGGLCICPVCKQSFNTKADLDDHCNDTGHTHVEPKSNIQIEILQDTEVDPQYLEVKVLNSLEKQIQHINCDPLEIKEEELCNIKVKVPSNDAMQSVLQRCTELSVANMIPNDEAATVKVLIDQDDIFDYDSQNEY